MRRDEYINPRTSKVTGKESRVQWCNVSGGKLNLSESTALKLGSWPMFNTAREVQFYINNLFLCQGQKQYLDQFQLPPWL